MIISTDGREFVYGVFQADGFECEDLLDIFSSEQSAESLAVSRRTLRTKEFASLAESGMVDRTEISVRMLQVKR